MSALVDRLSLAMLASPDHTALDPCEGARVPWSQLPGLVTARAADLAARFDPARPVALQLDHGPDLAILELALIEARIPALSVPAFFTQSQRDHALAACGAQAIFESSPFEARPMRSTAPVPLPSGTARITFTSGSTGAPKGICLSAAHMVQVAQSVVDALGVGHAGRHLALLPPGILLETVAGFLATMLAGGSYVCPPQAAIGLADPFRPDFAAMLRTIAERHITSLILVPEYLSGLVAAMEASGIRLPELTLVAVGGARTPSGLLERARACGLPLRQGYGLTECASVVSLEDDCGSPAGSVGKPLGHARAEIAPDGEILLHGPTCLGVIGGDSPPSPFPTGDIGRIDSAGRLWIDGRKSNLLVTSFGRNVSPEWVEAALVAQPGVAQAMVHGDGLARPEALLVASNADADLGRAVAAANAILPAYAQVANWREVAPFTPDSGHLTGNGRLRRQAIAATWLDGEPTFFNELEAATWRERLAFLTIPQVRAGLAGTITLQTYRDYLAQAWHHVRHTVPLLKAARARLGHRPDLAAALDEYVEEEEGHDEWILSDIRATGADADRVRKSDPAPETAAMVAHAYDRIANGNPVSFFGMVYVLESVSVALAQRGASSVMERLGLPKQAFSYLTSHGALDQDHIRFFAGLVNGLDDPLDRDAIVQMAREMFGLFGAMFAGISMEDLHVAA